MLVLYFSLMGFTEALLGDTFQEAKNNGRWISIFDIQRKLDETGNYKLSALPELHRKIFHDGCLEQCPNNGRMTFVYTPEGQLQSYLKRHRVCRLEGKAGFNCPSGEPKISPDAYQRHSFIHFLRVEKHQPERKARHIARLPPFLEEDWGHETEHTDFDAFRNGLKSRFDAKFSRLLTQLSGNHIHEYSDWKFTSVPLDKTDARSRSDRIKIHLPSMTKPAWFLHHSEDSTFINLKFQEISSTSELSIPQDSTCMMLYLPIRFARPDLLDPLFEMRNINRVDFVDHSNINSNHGTLIEFDFSGQNSVEFYANDRNWNQFREGLLGIMMSTHELQHNRTNLSPGRLSKYIPRGIKRKEYSIKIVWHDPVRNTLSQTRDGEMRKISFSEDTGLIGIFFTKKAIDNERLVNVRSLDNERFIKSFTDNKKGFIWMQINVKDKHRLFIESRDLQNPVPIELKSSSETSDKEEPNIQSGVEFLPSQDLISRLLNSLAEDDLTYINQELIDNVESLELRTAESIQKEVVRWAYNLAEGDDQNAYVSTISRRARLAWYLLQQKYLGIEDVKAMSDITDLLERMPEFMRLPPDVKGERWSRWTRRREYVDLEASQQNRNLRMFVSHKSYSELRNVFPNIVQDDKGNRWISEQAIPADTPKLDFDSHEHPYTAKFTQTPEQWVAELISLMDLGDGWQPIDEYDWAGNDYQSIIWTGTKDTNEHKKMVEPRRFGRDYGNFQAIQNNPHPLFSRQKKNLEAPYFSLDGRNFSLMFRIRQRRINNHHQYESFIVEYNQQGDIAQYCQFGGSDINKFPSWLTTDEQFNLEGKNLLFLFDPIDGRYFERETLRSIHLLYLKSISFNGLDADEAHFGRKGASSEGLGLFHDTSNKDDDHIVFSPIYSGINQKEIQKRYLERLGWWFDEN